MLLILCLLIFFQFVLRVVFGESFVCGHSAVVSRFLRITYSIVSRLLLVASLLLWVACCESRVASCLFRAACCKIVCCGLVVAGCLLRIVSCGLLVADCLLWVVCSGLFIARCLLQNSYSRLLSPLSVLHSFYAASHSIISHYGISRCIFFSPVFHSAIPIVSYTIKTMGNGIMGNGTMGNDIMRRCTIRQLNALLWRFSLMHFPLWHSPLYLLSLWNHCKSLKIIVSFSIAKSLCVFPL